MFKSNARKRPVTCIACVLASLAAIAGIIALEGQADASRSAQIEVAQLKNDLGEALTAAWNASPGVGGNSVSARRALKRSERGANRQLADLRSDDPVPVLARIPALLREEYAANERIYQLGSTQGYGTWINYLMVPQNTNIAQLFTLLNTASRQYDARADRGQTLSEIGAAVTILLLLAGFLTKYRRAARLAELNRREAITDALTGLANRRALIDDLDAVLGRADEADPRVLALFDLDGFKQYNDAFGHAAGDVLLTRLARALRDACAGRATAYRLGGDEFCLLGTAGDHETRALLMADAAAALAESGETWTIGCSAGVVVVPEEAVSVSEALALADVRMYACKRSRSSAARQTADALLCLIDERSPGLGSHIDNVAEMAKATAEAMRLDEGTVREIGWAAELHDLGKAAIPDAILDKPGPLDEEEWKLIHRHTLLGERILLAAPALVGVAKLVRSSHERFDGGGYPDGLRGEDIPLGSRIIFVCDAFDAMTSQRSYNEPMTVSAALAELRRCAGSQFDARVVDAFTAVVQGRASEAAPLAV
ncbi:MAG: diguanylate cyclase [Solirubrobacterales bacterium]|nr:diguanylate cyclase [Solirubrobacterales bacterium]